MDRRSECQSCASSDSRNQRHNELPSAPVNCSVVDKLAASENLLISAREIERHADGMVNVPEPEKVRAIQLVSLRIVRAPLPR